MSDTKQVYDRRIVLTKDEVRKLERVVDLGRQLIRKGYGGDVQPLAQMLMSFAQKIKAEDGKVIYRQIFDEWMI